MINFTFIFSLLLLFCFEKKVKVKEKSKLMPKAVEENWTIFFEHDPLHQACKVHFDGKHFRLKKSVIISE